MRFPFAISDKNLPADTRLWAALQRLGGGTWGGCVYDVERIIAALEGTGDPDDIPY